MTLSDILSVFELSVANISKVRSKLKSLVYENVPWCILKLNKGIIREKNIMLSKKMRFNLKSGFLSKIKHKVNTKQH